MLNTLRSRAGSRKYSVPVLGDQSFIPESSLQDILPDNDIEECIREEGGFDEPQTKDYAHAVQSGGRKIFLTLVLSYLDICHLAKFVVPGHAKDSKLPFSLKRLESIFTGDSGHDEEAVDAALGMASQFFDRQWKVISPSFKEERTHRRYKQQTIFPFLHQESSLRQGGFGVVGVVTLAGTQHNFSGLDKVESTQNVRVVRKILKPDNISTASDHANEDRILTLLRMLKHDNIVRLLVSYTIETMPLEHTFLFPLADTGSLDDVLHDISKRAAWLTQFSSDYALFQQLYGLTSAVECLHNYVVKVPNGTQTATELIGCHYDLKPANVLVDKGRLLLADFGLSRLRPGTSKSLFEHGQGDYMAPECEPIDDRGTLGKGIISRPSDIWSLGCVLLEILVYHSSGHSGTESFSNDRKAKIRLPTGSYTTFKFYGYDSEFNLELKPAVQQLLDNTNQHLQFSSSIKGLLPCIQEMLILEPMRRLKAGEITSNLFLHAHRLAFEDASQAFGTLSESYKSLALEIEKQKFFIWGCGSRLQHFDENKHSNECKRLPDAGRDWLRKSPRHFAEITYVLQELIRELNEVNSLLEGARQTPAAAITWPVCSRIQELVFRLWGIQELQEADRSAQSTPSLLRSMESYVEVKMTSSDNKTILKETWTEFGHSTPYKNIGRLAALKFMRENLKSKNKDGKDLMYLGELFPNLTLRGIHKFSTEYDRTTALVEHFQYLKGEEESQWRALHDRARNLANLLGGKSPDGSPGELPEGLESCVLKCIGYFHEPKLNAFGFKYSFPLDCPRGVMPVTLNEVIANFKRPELETLFRLALAIVRCVSSLHKIPWLHKDISSHNVLFFDSKSQGRNLATQFHTRSSSQVPERQDRGRPRVREGLETKAQNLTVPENLPAKPKSRLRRLLSRPPKAKSLDEPLPPLPTSPAPKSDDSRQSSRKPSPTRGHSQAGMNVDDKAMKIQTMGSLWHPYLVGFDHSRENKAESFTQDVPRESAQELYRHPDYRGGQKSQRYLARYDWYATGLVLLEMGLWQTAQSLACSSRGQAAKKGFLEVVPELDSVMGRTYREAMNYCLDPDDSDDDLYEELVVRKLARCFHIGPTG